MKRYKASYIGEIITDTKSINSNLATSILFRNEGTNTVKIRELEVTLANNEVIELSNDPGVFIDMIFNPVFTGAGTNKLLVIKTFTELVEV